MRLGPNAGGASTNDAKSVTDTPSGSAIGSGPGIVQLFFAPPTRFCGFCLHGLPECHCYDELLRSHTASRQDVARRAEALPFEIRMPWVEGSYENGRNPVVLLYGKLAGLGRPGVWLLVTMPAALGGCRKPGIGQRSAYEFRRQDPLFALPRRQIPRTCMIFRRFRLPSLPHLRPAWILCVEAVTLWLRSRFLPRR